MTPQEKNELNEKRLDVLSVIGSIEEAIMFLEKLNFDSETGKNFVLSTLHAKKLESKHIHDELYKQIFPDSNG